MAARAGRHRSFRELAGRADLQLSHTFLWYAVRVRPQLESLPPEIAMALPLSHHRLLVHVPREGDRADLVQRAISGRLGKRELEHEIRRLVPRRGGKTVRRGQPLVTMVRRPGRVAGEIESPRPADSANTRPMKTAEVEELRATLVAVRARCEELERAIVGVIVA